MCISLSLPSRSGPGLSVVASGLVLLALSPAALAAPRVRVPDDAPNLARAIRQVSDGGVVEIAPGVYPPPVGGFRIRSAQKSFTVRAQTPGSVVFDGGGRDPILLLQDGGPTLGKPVRFEGLVFRHAYSEVAGQGAAVTVMSRDATFVDCRFLDNRTAAPSAGGAGVWAWQGARVTFEDSAFRRNVVSERGGGLLLFEASAVLRRSVFEDNRAADPGGGAVFVLDGELRIERSLFTGNRSGFVGGAIYAFGRFESEAPETLVTVVDSTFRGNLAIADPCCPVEGPASGGAIIVEERSRLRVLGSVFEDNQANWGGALASYRAPIEIDDSELVNNTALRDLSFVAVGGAIQMASADFPVDGETNRRSPTLEISSTRISGGGNGIEAGATQGGCIALLGDTNRQYGAGGVTPVRDLDRNRIRAFLDGVVFDSCRVAASQAPGSTLGGAVFSVLSDLEVTNSLFLDNDAGDGSGGSISLLTESRASIERSHFHGNRALRYGGTIHADGVELRVSESVFRGNRVGDGSSVPVYAQSGSVLFVQPSQEFGADAVGEIRGSIFDGNEGVPLFGGDSVAAPVNRMVYNDNVFAGSSAGDKIHFNALAGAAGNTVAELNRLIVRRPGGDSTRKVSVGNRARADSLASGILVAAPPRVRSGLPPAELPARVFYAWTGGSAELDGAGLSLNAGQLELEHARTLELMVDGSSRDQEAAVTGSGGGACRGDLCLDSERFLVEASWRDFGGREGRGELAPLRSDGSGLLYFFDPENWEVLVKVLDGCELNGHFWIFAAATTNVEYTLRVTDLATAIGRSFPNPLGRAARALIETEGFPCEADPGLGAGKSRGIGESGDFAASRSKVASTPLAPTPLAPTLAVLEAFSPIGSRTESTGACSPSASVLCFGDNRFRVEVSWRDFESASGSGKPVPGGADDSGLFYFFDPDNWELLVKVLDGCALNGRFWVFAAATTNVEYTLTVTDTQSGRAAVYENRLGQRADAILDTDALPVCS